jgi:hypothetical protein
VLDYRAAKAVPAVPGPRLSGLWKASRLAPPIEALADSALSAWTARRTARAAQDAAHPPFARISRATPKDRRMVGRFSWVRIHERGGHPLGEWTGFARITKTLAALADIARQT